MNQILVLRTLTLTHQLSAITDTLNKHYRTEPYSANTTYPISAFITHLVYLRGTTISVDVERLTVSVPVFSNLLIGLTLV